MSDNDAVTAAAPMEQSQSQPEARYITQSPVEHSTDTISGPSSSTAPESMASTEIAKCQHCSKSAADDGSSDEILKQCLKCHSIAYCSRECQKADYKIHKKSCAALAQAFAVSNAPRPMQSRAAPKKAGVGRGLQKWQFDT